MNNEEIDSLRQFLGTLPARTSEESWIEPRYVRGISKMKVIPVSPEPHQQVVKDMYKSLFTMATSTWGDGNIDGNWSCKWEKVAPAAKYMVVWNVLHMNTLPTANESMKFTFETIGGPRHFFDQVARTRIGAGFACIGSRDNSRLACEFILYSKLYDILHVPQGDEEIDASDWIHDAFCTVKKAYRAILNLGKGNYQIARALLPMSAHNAFTSTYDFLSLLGMMRRRFCLSEEEYISAYSYLIRKMIKEQYRMNMVADILRPPCHISKKCGYAGSMQGHGGLAFSNLFAPKDPMCVGFAPKDQKYAEFNESCTDSAELIKYNVGYVAPNEHMNIPPDYEEAKPFLTEWEVAAFES